MAAQLDSLHACLQTFFQMTMDKLVISQLSRRTQSKPTMKGNPSLHNFHYWFGHLCNEGICPILANIKLIMNMKKTTYQSRMAAVQCDTVWEMGFFRLQALAERNWFHYQGFPNHYTHHSHISDQIISELLCHHPSSLSTLVLSMLSALQVSHQADMAAKLKHTELITKAYCIW